MNFFISVIAWFLWNWAEFSIRKTELDEDGNPTTNYTFKEYKAAKWQHWIGSFFTIIVLLWIGAKQIDLTPLAPIVGENIGWNDFYYLGAGAAWEVIMFSGRWVRNKFKNKS